MAMRDLAKHLEILKKFENCVHISAAMRRDER